MLQGYSFYGLVRILVIEFKMALNIQTKSKDLYNNLNKLRTNNNILFKENKQLYNIINKINKKDTRVSINKQGKMVNINKIKPLNYNVYLRKNTR